MPFARTRVSFDDPNLANPPFKEVSLLAAWIFRLPAEQK